MKYNPEFALQLLNGVRREGHSVAELCQMWNISLSIYNDWIKDHKTFAEAAKIGDRDCAAWWQKLCREVSIGTVKGNASLITAAMKNIPGIGWKDRVEDQELNDEPIQKITIDIIPPK